MRSHIRHLAIIPDGNRRYARKFGLAAWKGHKIGIDNMKKIAIAAFRDFKISVLTIYSFSSKNFKRPSSEVNALMKLFVQTFEQLSKSEDIHRYKVRVRAIGKMSALPQEVRAAIRKAETLTAHYSKFSLNLAVAYDGRQEIIEATKILTARRNRITEKSLTKATWFGGFPPPDLIIRTSGEQRLSGFLLWGSTYSEFFFSNKLWPEFRVPDLRKAISYYKSRQRRFGN